MKLSFTKILKIYNYLLSLSRHLVQKGTYTLLKGLVTEAATVTVFKISVLFFQEQPFYNFPGGSYLFVEQTCFVPGGSNVLRTCTNFPGGFIEQTCFFKEVLSVCQTDLIISSNRY